MIEAIAALWGQGKALSTIGEELNVSRGKVAGVIHRARRAGDARFRLRPIAARAREEAKVGIAKPTTPVEKPPIKAAPPPAPPPRPRLLIELRQGQCLWPVGEAADGRHLFCGQPRDSRRPYCEAHCAKVGRVSASPASPFSLSPRASARATE